ncbi:MAG TPA: polysaccharide deacetylase family protein [Saprospiraceae bacterium]|nr:polysaccharide deacetylase family protein [Saprospiraceae bacterium]
MSASILIYADFDSPRLRYALDLIFVVTGQTAYRLTTDWSSYRACAGPRMAYSQKLIEPDELRIPPCGLLQETSIRPIQADVQERQGLPAFFFCADTQNADTDFDLLALVFFLCSRYEEYLPGPRDAHGRFPAQQSWAQQHDFLHQPLAQQWALHLLERLAQRFPAFRFERPAFRFQPTFDVDMAWAYRYKSPWRQAAAVLRDVLAGDRQALKLRQDVLSNKVEDPFFTFADIEEWHRDPASDPLFFFHLGDYGRFDKNISHRHPMLRTLVQRLSAAHHTGLHPSWKAANDHTVLEKEARRYEEITGHRPTRSRQHFLRMELPRTYQELLDAGIREDYTMGYAEAPGFRAGMALPFPWYDLEAERCTELMLHPFTVMDVTLKEYQQLSPEEGLHSALRLLETVRETGGVFCTLWHNSSFSDIGQWKPWRAVYREIIAEAARNGNHI